MKLNKVIKFFRVEHKRNPSVPKHVPKDMLRYDLAFMHCPIESENFPEEVHSSDGIVAFPSFRDAPGGKVTHERWGSFSLTLCRLDRDSEWTLRESLLCAPEDWMTFRHPCAQPGAPWPTGIGAVDYGKLEPIPLKRLLEIKRDELGVLV